MVGVKVWGGGEQYYQPSILESHRRALLPLRGFKKDISIFSLILKLVDYR
jgi:hypothetical protein